MTECKHEFDILMKSCGCEIEICYRCTHQVQITVCDWCRREDKEE